MQKVNVVNNQDRPALSRDTQVMMAFQSQKKSVGAAYVLWFFFGLIGGHRFYAGKIGSAIAMLVLTITVIGVIVTGIWALIDAFLIPGMIEKKNREIMHMVSL